ncbi:hypothetical protein Hamer_G023832 [Homarus americanus]|uniref:Uncharacterized protein n=1 Tax=Homarus americanus TaxID=6706 RepID=A0A8J5K568_HOMAM|nr:hypothetical protein Hamer_G023832 [Homarus americanus]
MLPVPGAGVVVSGVGVGARGEREGAGWSHGSRGRGLVRAWRRGVGVCMVLVAASFSFFLVSSPQRTGLYTRVIFTFHHAPEYIMDIMVPSINASTSSSPSSLTSKTSAGRGGGGSHDTERRNTEGEEEELEQKGFLVHTPGCIIPDFDPFHHTITRFISNPIKLTCKGPPALTSAKGTTLYYHREVLHDHLDHYLNVYERLSAPPTTTKASSPSSSSTLNISSKTSHSGFFRASSIPSFPRTPPTPPPSTSTVNRVPHIGDMDVYIDFTSNTSSSEVPASSSSRPSEVKCCYRAIYRVEQQPHTYNAAADGRWRYSQWCEPLAGPETTIRDESVLVYCNMSDIIVYKNVHYFIQRHKLLATPPPRGSNTTIDINQKNIITVAEQQNTSTSANQVNITAADQLNTMTPSDINNENTSSVNNSNPSCCSPRVKPDRDSIEKLSVIIFGTDSASRLNMQRHLPKTYRFLTKELGAVDLAGFNKVGDNTFPNLIPVLSGLTTQELANHTCVPKREKYDDCNWVWKDFKKNGYVTAYMEPTDYYGRPFFLASEKEIGTAKHGNSNVCQGDKFSIQVIQDYSLEVARTFLDTPTFGLYWSASLSHDYINMLRHADIPHLHYLHQLQEAGALNHTALFFVSDHGMRWGSIRSTYVGMLEERLPYVLLYLPPWFRDKYHAAFKNLQTNTRRLTANYDLYQTLLDIAYGSFADLSYVTSKPQPDARGISIFQEIPRGRTCADAGIPEHFCTCQDTKEIPLHDPVLHLAAAFLKETLNQDLSPYSKCIKFSKIRVLTGRVSGSNKQLAPQDTSSDVRSYLLQATLSPGNVMVEATLRYNPQPQLFQVAGEVSRINEYGPTSSCLHHDVLRKFCFCKNQLHTLITHGPG